MPPAGASSAARSSWTAQRARRSCPWPQPPVRPGGCASKERWAGPGSASSTRAAARIAAQTANAAAGLRWSAPQTGIWRIEIRSAGQTQRQTVTLAAARENDIGGGPGRPVLVALNGRSPAIAQGAIDWPGDEDWFAVGMSAADSYTIYTVLGGLGATRGEVLLPGAAGPTPLGVHANGKTL